MIGKGRCVAGAFVLAFTVAAAPLQAQRGQGFRGQPQQGQHFRGNALRGLGFRGQAQPGVGFRGQEQQGLGLRGQGGLNLGQSLDIALDPQSDLDLTQDQVGRLQELKVLIDGDVAALAEEMRAVREGLRGGETDRVEGLRRMQVLRGELITASAPLRGRVQEILTVEQHSKLQPLVRQARPGRGGVRGSQAPGAGPSRGRGMVMGVQGRPRINRRAIAPDFRRGRGGFPAGAEGQGDLP